MSGMIQRLFWGWDAPVLEKAVAFLCEGWNSARALDLSTTLLLVPNGESGRRLREALAQTTNETGTAAFVPHLWLPEQALLPQTRRFEAATPLQAQMAWQRALELVPLEELTALFPKLPAERGWGWQAETARMLAELKMLLGTGGLTFADTANAPAAQRDAARWQDLAQIEGAYFDELAQAGVTDAQALKRRHAHEPVLPEGVERIVVLASPDLPPLLDAWIAGCAKRGLRVVIAVQAPEAMAHAFDACGRPLTNHWGEDAGCRLPFENEQIHVTRDPAAQAARTLELMRELVPQGRTALGVCDAEVGSLLLEKLTLEDARSFEPGGIPVQREGLWHVLDCFKVLLGSGAWRAFAALLRIAEFRDAVVPKEDEGIIWMGAGGADDPGATGKVTVSALLRAADEFASDHLPVTLEHALELPLARHPVLLPAVKRTLELLEELRRQTPTQAARTLILRLLGEKKFNPDAPGHRERTELASEWLRITEELELEARRFGLKPKAEDTFSLSLECLSQSRLAEPRGDIDLVLQGWLELLWERAPNLIVTGLNEEHVPGIFISHPFLPDGLRAALGLPCQNTRFARDAFILAALAQQRMETRGRLRLLCSQWSDGGDALRPSRLLFLCDDAVLPQRVAHLFPKEEDQPAEAEPPRSLAWQLQPDWTPREVTSISPSRLRAYLNCPFRYFLAYEKNMSAVEMGKRELDAAEFGNLIHHAFHRLFLDESMRDCMHGGQIAKCLEAAARERVREVYGVRPAPLITLQLDSVLQRLQHAAGVEAKNRQEGWRCIEAELQIGGKDDALPPFLLAEARLKGRIDRVEQNVDGRLRIVDFKSSDKRRDPHEAHYKVISARTKLTDADEWKCFDLPEGKRAMWLDLQLPLYAAALQQRGQKVGSVAYFALPKSIQETEIREWKSFDETLVEAAVACAEVAVKRIREGEFWPPAERAVNDGFEEMLLGDPLQSVQPPLA